MVFYTRHLDDLTNSNSPHSLRAYRKLQENGECYARYFEVIKDRLPPQLLTLATHTLHDSIVLKTRQTGSTVTLVLHGNDSLGGWRKRIVTLTFSGVRGRPRLARLRHQRWTYEEMHLASDGRFKLCVLFNHDELEIEAAGLRIRPRRRAVPDNAH